jgi:LPXTG-motif cell wall-anchored protein
VRRLAVLFASGIVALGTASTSFAQSTASDRQAPGPTQAQAADEIGTPPPLTPEPRTKGSGTSEGSGETGSKGSTGPKRRKPARPDEGAASGEPSPSSVARTELPNTGADAVVIGLLGAALVLLGVGLRLRIADVRR